MQKTGPMSIKIPRLLIAELITHAMEDDPNECCGLLLGVGDEAVEIHRMSNVDRKPISRYTMQSGELVAAQEKLKEIQDKEREIQQYQANTERSLQQRQRTHRDLMLDEIKRVVLIMAEKRGAALVFDTAGTSALGIPNVLYSNPSWDITDDVLAKINESAPSE